jgi:hypothetical protein
MFAAKKTIRKTPTALTARDLKRPERREARIARRARKKR